MFLQHLKQYNAHPRKFSVIEACGQLLNPSNEKNTIVQATKTLTDLLDNISSKPDNKALRKLRINHPVFYQKFSSLSRSLILLNAVGFDFVLESKYNEDDVIPDDKERKTVIDYLLDISNEEAVEESIRLFILDVFNDSCIADRLIALCDALDSHLLMEMFEPNIDTTAADGFESWLKWFDLLKQNSEIIQNFQQSLSSNKNSS